MVMPPAVVLARHVGAARAVMLACVVCFSYFYTYGSYASYYGVTKWYLPQPGCFCDDSIDDGCFDTDLGVKDSNGDNCADYTNPAWCGGLDDSDFSANAMCCACGGGLTDGKVQQHRFQDDAPVAPSTSSPVAPSTSSVAPTNGTNSGTMDILDSTRWRVGARQLDGGDEPSPPAARFLGPSRTLRWPRRLLPASWVCSLQWQCAQRRAMLAREVEHPKAAGNTGTERGTSRTGIRGDGGGGDHDTAAVGVAAAMPSTGARLRASPPDGFPSANLPAIASVVHSSSTADDRSWNATAAICLALKGNEAELDEWVSYHLGLGFDEIYVYDNSASSATNYSLMHWARMASWTMEQAGGEQRHGLRVHVQPWPDHTPHQQIKAYKHCVDHHLKPRGVTWVAFFDIDEFLVLKNHSSVVPFLIERSPPRGSVAVNWVLFGTSNHTRKVNDAPVTLIYQHRVFHKPEPVIKSIARVDDFERMRKNPHSVWFTDEAEAAGAVQVDTLGRPIGGGRASKRATNSFRAAEWAVLHHYRYKSLEEWHWRNCIRGGGGILVITSPCATRQRRRVPWLSSMMLRGKRCSAWFHIIAWRTLGRKQAGRTPRARTSVLWTGCLRHPPHRPSCRRSITSPKPQAPPLSCGCRGTSKDISGL